MSDETSGALLSAVQKSIAVCERFRDTELGLVDDPNPNDQDASLMISRVLSYLRRGLRESGIREP